MNKIVKRNGQVVDFEPEKVRKAIEKANAEVATRDKLTKEQIDTIVEDVTKTAMGATYDMNVEEIQNLVEDELMLAGKCNLARHYINFRSKRALARKANTTDDAILSLIECANEEVKQENSNKNPTVVSVQRDYMAGEVSKDLAKRILLPEDIVEAHENGEIHFHDADYYSQHMTNCCLDNLEDAFENTTVISETMIDRPKSFSTACNIATQMIAQVASSQYGGQTITLSHLVPFVEVSRKKIKKQVVNEFKTAGIKLNDEAINKISEIRLKEEIARGVQMIQYQIITLMTTNGQAPFVSIFMYLNEVPEEQKDDLAMIIEEMLHQRILGVKNEKGVYITPAFPKLLYVLEEDNIKEGDRYFWLTKLAAECTAKRMVPDYISEKKIKEIKEGDAFPCMGCRSFLTVDRYSENVGNISNAGNFDKHKGHVYYGRFNQGVVTLNLVDVACSSYGDMDKFWEILEERLELCHKALRCRHERLLGTPSDVAPMLWQHGVLARLKKGETIDKLLYNGYSTISLGYAGLYEMTERMLGVSHTEPTKGQPFAMKVMQALNDACEKWKAAENIDYSVYGTPLESTTYKFAKCLKKRFGVIPNVTDHDYITNSYHVSVREKINAFDKLSFESPFQKLSPGGAISYVEVPDMKGNIPAVIAVIQYIYENIMYAELNTKSDYCMKCGYDGEIQIVEEEDQETHKKKLPQQRSKSDVSSQTYLWIYRYTVLESGKNRRNQRSSSTSVNK